MNIEEFYQLLMEQQWRALVKYIHTHRQEIPHNSSLQHAASIFETEFLKQAVANRNSDIDDGLDLLFALHKSKHYELDPVNYRTLVIELVKRKSGIEAYNYALEFPDDAFCQKVISGYKSQHPANETQRIVVPAMTEMEWLEIFNRLFEIINQQDTNCYFTGDRFIKAVKKVQPYHPDYNQYIHLRNQARKSTTRKHFFYDIYREFTPHDRLRLVNEILYAVKPFAPHQSLAIEMLLGITEIRADILDDTIITRKLPIRLVVFISYAWDNETHKKWVLDLAIRLSDDNIEVILDQWELKAGRSLPFFAEQSIKNATKVLIIYSPEYKLKADHRTGGAGYEYSILNNALYHNQTNNDKIIPVLRLGDREKSIPDFMAQYIHIDFRSDGEFESSYQELLREIRDEPPVSRPAFDK